MSNLRRGVFNFSDIYEDITSISEFDLNNDISDEALILRILSGTVNIGIVDYYEVRQVDNFLKLPYIRGNNLSYVEDRLIACKNIMSDIMMFLDSEDIKFEDIPGSSHINNFSSIDNIINEIQQQTNQFSNFDSLIMNELDNTDYQILNQSLNQYFEKSKTINREFYEIFLYELSYFFLRKEISPISSFIHLYRIIELLSFNLPLIYSSQSKDYIGTFKMLKTFFSQTKGELSLFKKTANNLFKDDIEIIAHDFDFNILSKNAIELKKHLDDCMSNIDGFEVQIVNANELAFKIKFQSMIDYISNLRNRYFHLKDGEGQPNIKNKNYDILDLFYHSNLQILNWISILFWSFTKHGFEFFNNL